ncbi:MAG: helix-turn-helix domain-containing protein [Clostridia bacterium]|nr:helix-turn-helix domain-containing protein [Clostridia bacterium]
MQCGEKIKQFRKQAGLTQDKFANDVGVHYQTVSKWERNLVNPDISQYDVIVKTLNVTLEDLFSLPTASSVIGESFSQTKLGKSIKFLRLNNALSQSEFAQIFLASADTVSKWERGLVSPSIETLIDMSKHFNVSLSALYYGKITVQITFPITDNETHQDQPKINKDPQNKSKINKKTLIISICVTFAIICLSLTIVIFALKPNNSNPKPTPTLPSPIENATITHRHGEFYHNACNNYSNHPGVCILADAGTAVKASFTGTVTEINVDDILLGTGVTITGQGFVAIYHFIDATVGLKVGDVVEQGTTIGYVSEAVGESYKLGPHIRFELFDLQGNALDPEEYIIFS